ncbi:MAG: hypothetical protein AAGI50_14175 [Pseudomonadota bacterium]
MGLCYAQLGVHHNQRRKPAAAGAHRNRQHHGPEARVVPSANGAGTSALMIVTSAAKTSVWSSWQRFMAAGADGLLRHETRPPDPEPLANGRTAAVVEMTLKTPPHEAMH